MLRRLVLAAALLIVTGTEPALASQLVDRNASDVTLAVNAKGEALVTYKAAGKLKRVLAWGAVNAIAPTPGRQQVEFELDYAGGWGKYRRRDYAESFGGSCGSYTGQPLAWRVAVCTAPDGSFWALQAWQRALPNYGVTPGGAQSAWELHLSHWTGELPVLTIDTDWAYRRFDHLYGSFTYRGQPVFGFRSTRGGVPLDSFGRNLYIDTLDSSYGKGWKRENSFLAQRPNGTFCYGFYPHGGHSAGNGTRYRATIIGPGVTPDVMWEGAAPGPYDAAADKAANAEQKGSFAAGRCKVN
jgi:hypothetical protein